MRLLFIIYYIYHSTDVASFAKCVVNGQRTGFHQHLRRRTAIAWYSLNLGEVPFLVTQRAYTPGLQPTLDAVQMENMSTVSKCHAQAVFIIGGRIRLKQRKLVIAQMPVEIK